MFVRSGVRAVQGGVGRCAYSLLGGRITAPVRSSFSSFVLGRTTAVESASFEAVDRQRHTAMPRCSRTGPGNALTGAKETYYETLGIPQDASKSDIKKAYFRKAKSVHPDVNKNPSAKGDFVKLTEAYDVLKDERKRQQYDSSLRFSGGKHTPYEGAHPFGGGGGFPGGQWEVNEKEFEEWMRHHEATMNEFFKQFGQGGFTYTYSSTSRGGQEQMSGMMEELFKMGMMANMMFENMDPSMLSPFASEHMCRELRNRRDYYKFTGDMEVIERVGSGAGNGYLEVWKGDDFLGGVKRTSKNEWELESAGGKVLSTVVVQPDAEGDGSETINAFHGRGTNPRDFFAVTMRGQVMAVFNAMYLYSDGAGKTGECKEKGTKLNRKFVSVEMTSFAEEKEVARAEASSLDFYPLSFTVSAQRTEMHPIHIFGPVAHCMFKCMDSPSLARKGVKALKDLFL